MASIMNGVLPSHRKTGLYMEVLPDEFKTDTERLSERSPALDLAAWRFCARDAPWVTKPKKSLGTFGSFTSLSCLE